MPVKLMCTGDLMAGENVHHYHRGIATRFRGRYNDLVAEEVKHITRQADLLLVNLEASLATDELMAGLSIERGVYAAPTESIGLLKSLNHNVIANVANNHFGQHGPEAADFSVDQLNQNGILVTGRDRTPLVLNRGGHQISIWGCSLVQDRHYRGSYFKSSYETLPDELELPEKRPGECWIISIHWGEEYLTLQNEKQIQLAGRLSAAGFDYIIGHHPHVMQPVKAVGGAMVFFSHGNFIFDQNFSSLTQKGLVSLISLDDKSFSLYLSRQKQFVLSSLAPIDQGQLEAFCKAHFHRKMPLLMRIRMKLELMFRFYELNPSIIRTFTKRLWRS